MGHDVFLRLHETLEVEKEPFYFTFLRDPRERYLSHYHYLIQCAGDPNHRLHKYAVETVLYGGAPIDIREFAASGELGNVMTAYLAAANHPDLSTKRWEVTDGQERVLLAMDAIKKMSFVGTVDAMKIDLEQICLKVGVPFSLPTKNKTASRVRFEELDDETRELITDANRDDMLLYERAFI